MRGDPQLTHNPAILKNRKSFLERFSRRVLRRVSAAALKDQEGCIRQLKLRLQSPLNKTLELDQISAPCLLLNFGGQPVCYVHFFLSCFLQLASQEALQGLKENDQHKQERGSGCLRRNLWGHPSAEPPHEAQIQQRQKRGRDRIYEIFLPSDLQKVVPLDHVDQNSRRQKRRKSQCGAGRTGKVARHRPA